MREVHDLSSTVLSSGSSSATSVSSFSCSSSVAATITELLDEKSALGKSGSGMALYTADTLFSLSVLVSVSVTAGKSAAGISISLSLLCSAFCSDSAAAIFSRSSSSYFARASSAAALLRAFSSS